MENITDKPKSTPANSEPLADKIADSAPAQAAKDVKDAVVESKPVEMTQEASQSAGLTSAENKADDSVF